MDPVAAELQWWALGEYRRVIDEYARRGRSLTHEGARKTINRLIAQQFEQSKQEPLWYPSGNPLWRPRDAKERSTLRAAIRTGKSLDHGIR
jgi:hypothetical protein